MRREFGMSDEEFWHELTLARLFKLMEIWRMMTSQGAGARSEQDEYDAAIAAGI